MVIDSVILFGEEPVHVVSRIFNKVIELFCGKTISEIMQMNANDHSRQSVFLYLRACLDCGRDVEILKV